MKISNFKFQISLLLPILAVLINLVALFPETTARSELNDNVFAFILVNQINKAWDAGHCPLSIVQCLGTLTDHWVSTFALGFPLPHYYQHLPHLVPVVIYRLLSVVNGPTLFTVFEWFKYLLLAIFPLSIYWAAKKLELPPLAAGFSALLAPLISTQYLYGTDFNAVVWRGSGMYTQLWGFVAAPLALASLYDTIRHRRAVLRSSLLLALTFAGHLVFGYIVALSSPLIVLATFLSNNLVTTSDSVTISDRLLSLLRPLLTLTLTLTFTFIFLSYWAIPLVLDNPWQNSHSVWDARDKFDSYGFLNVTQKLVNGDLFDANRLPVLTLLVALGFFAALIYFFEHKEPGYQKTISNLKSCPERSRMDQISNYPVSYLLLPLMFIQWYLLYWGRATWGPLINFLPLSDGIHLHRFVNGLHLPGIYLAGLGLSWIASSSPKLLKILNLPKSLNPRLISIPVTLILIILILFPIYSERLTYLRDNSGIIQAANHNFALDHPDFAKTVEFLKTNRSGRIYPGRPGNWGNDFNIGGVHAFMQFSMSDIDVSGFLPETWSPNSDAEQFFDENRLDHYQAFGIKTLIAPPDKTVPKFAKKIAQFGKFIIYDIPDSTEFEIATIPFQIIADKKTDLSILRLWLESNWPSYHAHPAVSLTNRPFSLLTSHLSLPSLQMLNLSNYIYEKTPTESSEPTSLFAANPFASPPPPATPSGKILSESRGFGRFQAIVSTPRDTRDTFLVLKASYHPSWRAYINNLPVSIIPVAPVFMAVPLPPCSVASGCQHTIEFRYHATPLKTLLIFVSLGSLTAAVIFRKKLDSLLP
jgi:hypothetical protein